MVPWNSAKAKVCLCVIHTCCRIASLPLIGSTSVLSSAARIEAHSYPGTTRLGVQRLRTLQEKKNAQAKAARRDIAMLLEKGRLETARIKTENSEYSGSVFLGWLGPRIPTVASHQRRHLRRAARASRTVLRAPNCAIWAARSEVSALIPCTAHLALTKCRCSTREPDPGVSEGVCAIIYAAPRTELKGEPIVACPTLPILSRPAELHLLRDILMHKYGREFSLAVMENRDGCVSERVRPVPLNPAMSGRDRRAT